MRRAGFTLLETLVALTMTALVLAALGGVVLRTATARTRATGAADRIASARTVLLRLGREIEGAVPPGAPGADATSEQLVVHAPADRDGSSTLRFATMGTPATPGASDLQEVWYAYEPDPRQPGAGTLVRRAGSSVRGQPMLAGVRRFRVRCFDGIAWREEWSPGRLPRAVEIGLELDDGRPLTTTVTVAAAG